MPEGRNHAYPVDTYTYHMSKTVHCSYSRCQCPTTPGNMYSVSAVAPVRPDDLPP